MIFNKIRLSNKLYVFSIESACNQYLAQHNAAFAIIDLPMFNLRRLPLRSRGARTALAEARQPIEAYFILTNKRIDNGFNFRRME